MSDEPIYSVLDNKYTLCSTTKFTCTDFGDDVYMYNDEITSSPNPPCCFGPNDRITDAPTTGPYSWIYNLYPGPNPQAPFPDCTANNIGEQHFINYYCG